MASGWRSVAHLPLFIPNNPLDHLAVAIGIIDIAVIVNETVNVIDRTRTANLSSSTRSTSEGIGLNHHRGDGNAAIESDQRAENGITTAPTNSDERNEMKEADIDRIIIQMTAADGMVIFLLSNQQVETTTNNSENAHQQLISFNFLHCC
jgi:hypothetical protein